VTPDAIVRHFPQLSIMGLKSGAIPLKDTFDVWQQEQISHAYFNAMKMIARCTYIGSEVATENLSQRFHKLLQRKWNPITKRNEFLTVRDFHS
jgi:hypothetical protein